MIVDLVRNDLSRVAEQFRAWMSFLASTLRHGPQMISSISCTAVHASPLTSCGPPFPWGP